MNKSIIYIAITVFLLSGITNEIYCQGISFDNTGGKIVNNGTFRVKGGQVKSMPDTIGGRVEFTAFNPTYTQVIPNINFKQLVLSGQGLKQIDSLKSSTGMNYPLSTQDSLLMIDSANIQIIKQRIYAHGPVENTASVYAIKEVRLLNESVAQDLWGNGNFPYLNIDNPNGVNIIKGGGFTVNNQLELTRGQLKNNIANNFAMADSSMIVRHSEGSLVEEPSFGKNVDLKYVGGSEIISGKEVPADTTVVRDLIVENAGGLTLSKSLTVKNKITVSSQINTEPDSINRYILTLTSNIDPIYSNADAEIIGSLRRTYLRYDSTVMLFNNRYTFALFANRSAANGARELTFRVKPRTFPPFLNGTTKVKRYISVSAKDSAYAPVQFGLSLRIGYGWRHNPADAKNESNGLVVDKLKLQRWSGSEWIDQQQETSPQVDGLAEWAYNYSMNISSLGDFAIGMPGNLTSLILMSKVMLEGTYRFGAMQNDLRAKNLIPATPPDVYPYNFDPMRSSYNVPNIPDSAVDWVLLEFRNKVTNLGTRYLCCFLHKDGRIIDRDGSYPINLYAEGIDSGEYFLAVRHRNHLSVITENAISLFPDSKAMSDTLDFSKPDNLLGRENSLRILGLNQDGSLLFGLIAGDINGDGKIDEADLVGTWEDRDYEDLYRSGDINMSGFFNTRDFNFVWNNRGRSSLVK